jgi:hypothetical protein
MDVSTSLSGKSLKVFVICLSRKFKQTFPSEKNVLSLNPKMVRKNCIVLLFRR